MKNEVKLSVEEILKQKSFQTAKIVAGKKGITRTVKWVHVMEITNVGNLLNGNELILTTGIGWKDSEESMISLVKQLIECQVSGLCVELGEYVSEISSDLIKLADRFNFPIIVFKKEVRFVDITEEIHTLIIKKHYQMVTDLEEYSRKLNEVLLEADPKKVVLNMLQKQLQMPVIYLSNDGHDSIVSNKSENENNNLLQLVKESSLGKKEFITRQKINVLNQDYAELIIVDNADSVTEFEKLLLDRTVTALAQIILRDLWIEERRNAKQTDWIQKWLSGEHNEEQIERYLEKIAPGKNLERAIVVLIKVDYDPDDSSITYLKLFLRNIFQNQGFHLLPAMMENSLVLILIDNRIQTNYKQRVGTAIERLINTKYLTNHLHISVGKPVHHLTEIKKSYEFAKEASSIREKVRNEKTSYFYEDLHIYRIIKAAHDQGILYEFVSDYLKPVLLFDRQNNTKLMNTLSLYLKFNGSKKETAKHLFIVRQTLYHRLEKLYELIGEDFMEPPKRQAFEFAVAAYEYLDGAKQSP
ncbi:PucR family transcriptional regulator [Cytobacillus gottheilii]|uniref:PucR family transcriptional regulator ligand-binding domain-containing protein n=1 Tax=Cytobacillus gottheilii TaxID=859144 RepID=A0ABX8FEL5_9BACI|nr:PucR family transcriptional regulator [Cytobacillus gottheilii]QVY62452.1 PucR family transcriptional regulator ligand-binding domain-containing protein [Cytobacillus gottheilii]